MFEILGEHFSTLSVDCIHVAAWPYDPADSASRPREKLVNLG